MVEETSPLPSPSPSPPSNHPRGTDVHGDDDDDDVLALNSSVSFLPNEIMADIMTYLDVRSLVEIKRVARQWKLLSTTAIDAKGTGTTKKAFDTNQELRNAVKRYCPIPQGGNIYDANAKQQYCDRKTAEEIACTYGWPINKWNVSEIKDFTGIFSGQGTRWNYDIEHWESSEGISLFNEDISLWDVSQAITMEEMFSEATHFNQDISTWDISNVTNMNYMFHKTKQFHQNLSLWNVSNVTTMLGTFQDAIQFNNDLSSWDVGNVTIMTSMFYSAYKFNQNISTWNVSNCIDMSNMFTNAIQFNQNISQWNVSNVITMDEMFYSAKQFNQNLSSWDVSNVTSMVYIFSDEAEDDNEEMMFHQDISTWERWDRSKMEPLLHQKKNES